MGDKAVLGRSDETDIQASEQYVSRRQMQFTLMPEGWVVENLSSRPIRINGKKYKRKKQVLLETGDLLGIGVSTEILYVAPGDDPQAALQAYHLDGQLTEQDAQSPPPPPTAPAESGGEPPKTPPPEPEGPETKRLDHVDQQQRSRKRRRYLVFTAVYLLGVLALVLWLSTSSGDNSIDSGGRPAVLSKEQIEDALTAPRREALHTAMARNQLKKARRYYADRHAAPDSLYRCVKAYKLAQAYSGRQSPPTVLDSDHLTSAEEELIDRVFNRYTNAWYLERQHLWEEAHEAFGELLVTVPEHDPNDPAYAFVENVKAHRAYINRHMSREN
ncbi:MAG: FHA domain-containing protein [Phycisphaerae bacterium]|nr:FHA domain-containing protein [Phycisphaerae bacterium]